uniref:Uncharacterized LOC103466703 n=2 Tax=Poecilia reticulata TaxID=8081 RepID=A0A3P9NWA7_POERE
MCFTADNGRVQTSLDFGILVRPEPYVTQCLLLTEAGEAVPLYKHFTEPICCTDSGPAVDVLHAAAFLSFPGLSSFQESVAMDRIQRIMGVLQNPFMGEKYVDIILKMEAMLKSWFPHVKLQEQLAATQTEGLVPSKRLKLSPITTSAAGGSVFRSDPPTGTKALRVTDLTPPEAYSANNLKWLHTSPICSPTAEEAQAGPRHPLLPRDKDLTQDSAVSSSTDGHAKTDSVPRGPPPGKINAPCLERLLKSTDSIITRKETGGLMGSSWS